MIRLADLAGNIDTGQISHENIKDYKVIKSGSKAEKNSSPLEKSSMEIVDGSVRSLKYVLFFFNYFVTSKIKATRICPPSDGYVFVVCIIAKSNKKRKSCVIE